MCQGCQKRYYCSKICQRNDWDKHRAGCKLAQAFKKKCITDSDRDLRVLKPTTTVNELIFEIVCAFSLMEASAVIIKSNNSSFFQAIDVYGPGSPVGQVAVLEIQYTTCQTLQQAEDFLREEKIEYITASFSIMHDLDRWIKRTCRTEGHHDLISGCLIYEGQLKPM